MNNADSPSIFLTIVALYLTMVMSVYITYLWNYYKRYGAIKLFDISWSTFLDYGVFVNFFGATLPNGMKRTWVYNKQPYTKVAFLTLILIVSFAVSLAILFLLGALVWLLFGAVTLSFTILNFDLVKFGLVIAALIGLWFLGKSTLKEIINKFLERNNIIVFGAFLVAYILIPAMPEWIFIIPLLFFIFFNGAEMMILTLSFSACIALLVFGVHIIDNESWLDELANTTLATGAQFLNAVNLFDWGINLFANHWHIILICFLAPVFIFLAIAASVIAFNTVLKTVEWLLMKIYNVRRPCPVCGTTNEPRYISKNSTTNQPHPVPLNPGVYGTFYHRSPYNNDKLPTMLLNGKWKLKRTCQNPLCHDKITAATTTVANQTVGIGSDVHIAIVGNRASGKSYLLYGALAMLLKHYPNQFHQIDKTDATDIAKKKQRIDLKLGIQTAAENWHRAVQLIYKSPHRRMPYHIYCYDVAGEKFETDTTTHLTALEFYRNLNTIAFVIDVAALDLTGTPANYEIVEWINRQEIDDPHNIVSTLTYLIYTLKTKKGRETKEIDLHLVCVKKDMQYFEAAGYNSHTITPPEIETFIRTELGLNTLIDVAKTEFKTVNYHAVSVVSDTNDGLKNLFTQILKQQNVKI